MKILIACVTFNSYEALSVFIKSVDIAAGNAANKVEVTVAIGDNTEKNPRNLSCCSDNLEFLFFPYHTNLGYLGCAFKMMSELGKERIKEFDFVAISNVDVELEHDFFVSLLSFNDSNTAWIAPDIFTPSRGTHENPFMLTRPTKLNFLKWEMMYASPLLYGIIEKLSYFIHSNRHVADQPMTIYAGHGSFMLFTRDFIMRFGEFAYPTFMYAEEIFFAEKARLLKMQVTYLPDLKIRNVGSVSVSFLGKRWKCENNRRSLRVMRRLFFGDRKF